MNTTANRTWLLPEIPVVGRERGSQGAGCTEEKLRPSTLDGPACWQFWRAAVPGGLPSPPCPSRVLSHGPQPGGSPAPELLQPEAPSQARPHGHPPVPAGSSQVQTPGGASEGPHLTSAPPEPVASLPLSSWPPRSTSPILSHLPACHRSLFEPEHPGAAQRGAGGG